VAILGQPRLQVLHLREQFGNLRLQRWDALHLRPQRTILGFQLGQTVLCCAHATRLHPLRKSA